MTYNSAQRGFFARLRDLFTGVFSVWIRDREAGSPDAVYERVIGERVRQYADLKRAVAGILYMRNKIEGEIRDRRAELARLQADIARAVGKNDDEVAVVLITQKDGLLQDLERSEKELDEVSAECESAKTNLVKFRAEIRNLEREKVRMLAALANARARKRINEAFEGLSTEGEMRALEGVRGEIERMKAESRMDVDMDSGPREARARDPRRGQARRRAPRARGAEAAAAPGRDRDRRNADRARDSDRVSGAGGRRLERLKKSLAGAAGGVRAGHRLAFCYLRAAAAGVAELADATALEAVAARRAGSSPVPGTRSTPRGVADSTSIDDLSQARLEPGPVRSGHAQPDRPLRHPSRRPRPRPGASTSASSAGPSSPGVPPTSS